MKQDKLEPIFLTSSQIEILYENYNCDEEEREKVVGFEGCYIVTDTDSGYYDSAKSSMYDYEIKLYNKEEVLMGTAIGGYFNGGCGEKFNDDLTFYPPEPETKLSKLNIFMDNLVHKNLTLESKVSKIKEYIENL